MEATDQKVELRDRMRAALAGLPATAIRAGSAAIWERLATHAAVAGADRLLVYVSTGNEVDTRGLIRQLLAMGRRVCVPAFDATAARYIASELRDFDADLAPGKFNILEPKPEAVRPVNTADWPALLVPGLAFDTQGNRLGRGRGYFDRLLRDARGVRLALAYDFQIVTEVPAEAHDARMDFIVTENRVVNCTRKTK
jgi:5-formyltetrahydrofolate cyclo-ligase